MGKNKKTFPSFSKRLTYTTAFFCLFFFFYLSAAITELALGVKIDLPFVVIVILIFSASLFPAGIFYYFFGVVKKERIQIAYHPSKLFYFILLPMMLASIVFGIISGNLKGSGELIQQQQAEHKEKEIKDKIAAEQERFRSMTPEERKQAQIAQENEIIDKAEDLLRRWKILAKWKEDSLSGKEHGEPSSHDQITPQELNDMTASLDKINTNQPNNKKVRALLLDIKNAQIESLKIAKLELEIESKNIRIGYAEKLQNLFLDQQIEATISAEGKNKDTLHIYMPLANHVVAHDLSKKDGIIDSAKEAGFSKITLSNAFGGVAVWDLNN